MYAELNSLTYITFKENLHYKEAVFLEGKVLF